MASNFEFLQGNLIPYKNREFFMASVNQFKEGEKLKTFVGQEKIIKLIRDEISVIKEGSTSLTIQNGMLVSVRMDQPVGSMHCLVVGCGGQPQAGTPSCENHKLYLKNQQFGGEGMEVEVSVAHEFTASSEQEEEQGEVNMVELYKMAFDD